MRNKFSSSRILSWHDFIFNFFVNNMSTPYNNSSLPVVDPQGTDTEMLKRLQRETFGYFIDENCFRKGLIADKTEPGPPSSIAVIGLGLSSYIVGIEQGYISRSEGIDKTLTVLRFFHSSRQGTDPDATGYKGFYYHFLDMETGKRVWNCELSTVDTALLMAGVLTARHYYDRDTDEEKEIRHIADELYRRVDWQWALNSCTDLCHGWMPESGFLKYTWNNSYSEAHILYILALGSPTFPIPEKSYLDWVATFEWKKVYDIEYLYAGPLFIHQLSQIWIDFRGIYDDFNRKHGIDYFENSRRATFVQQQYAIENPLKYEQYGKYCWGISASDGPGPSIYTINGIERIFYDYIARGVPYGPDDGTVSPWAIVASLPFAPEIVLDTIRHIIERLNLIKHGNHGFHASFNPTFPKKRKNPNGWVSEWQFGLNQGPVVLMIENYWSGLIWKIFQKCPYVATGLQRGGFTTKL
jgi:hypothetical protein